MVAQQAAAYPATIMDIRARKTRFPSGSLLFHGVVLPAELRAGLEAREVTLRSSDELLRDPANCDAPTVLLLDHSLLERTHELAGLPDHVSVVAVDRETETQLSDIIDLSLMLTADDQATMRTLRTALELSADRRDAARAQLDLTRSREELVQLSRIGMALMSEHDATKLLRQITEQAMRFTNSDAGVLFLLEKPGDSAPLLRFKVLLSDSVEDLSALDEITLPIDSTSFVGHAAVTQLPLVVEDATNLPPGTRFQMNPIAQERFGYHLKSMLAIPMVDHRSEVVGVLELINRKCDTAIRLHSLADVEQHVQPYTDRDVQLVMSLAGQAAVSIENAQLYEQIEYLFESFVKASVTAIDQRDPATAGHSLRVASLATDLATAVQRSEIGRQAGLHFTAQQLRELRFAALLHDFGKVGVREHVLVKARKLPPEMWTRVEGRFDLIRCSFELEHEKERARLRDSGQDSTELDREFELQMKQLNRYWQAVCEANEPTVMPQETSDILDELASRKFQRRHRIEPYLTADELHYLQIPYGSLDERERLEIQSHAELTFVFLSQIPWTDDLKDIATYAAAHHEKLNGSGYPRQLRGSDIPIQTRIITVADIFDALTAADRPYKPAVEPERALDIIRSDASAGLLDPDVVQVMIESQVYRHVLETDWHKL